MPTQFSPATPRVLVIEDDSASREVVTDGLSARGFVVTGAEHGNEALDLLRSGYLPDLIILDLVMPSMDGWSFRVELRKQPGWAQIPVIALSAEGGPQAEAIDAAAFLLKPVRVSQLAEIGRQLLAAAARERMEQMEKMASLGLLSAGVAHEINNPLSYTLSNLHYIADELEEWGKLVGEVVPVERAKLKLVIEAVAEANQGADRVKGLVADLRTFARSDLPAQRPVDLNKVACFAIKLATPQTKHRIEVLTDFSDVPFVAADEPKIVQLVLNLVVNAAQAIPADAGRPARILIRTGQEPQGAVFIDVEDTGEGIPPGLRERIFEPFFTTKPPGVGTGLGLAICRRIAEAHRGQLTVQSELGKGSCFRLSLPAIQA